MRLKIQFLNWAIDVQPRDARLHAQRGWLLEQAGDAEGALRDYRRSIAFDPCIPHIHFHRGLILLQKNQPHDALADFEHELAISAESSHVHYFRATALLLVKEDRKALEAYALAVAAAPGDAVAYLGRGIAADNLGEFEAALADYTRVLELDPNEDSACLFRAEALFSLERYEAADAGFTDALCRGKMPARTLLGRAATRNRLRQYSAALADCNRCLELEEGNAAAWGERGWALLCLRRSAEAEHDLLRSLDLDPACMLAKSGLAWLYATSADPAMHDADRAVRALACAQAIQEAVKWRSVPKQRILAAALAENSRFAEAIAAQQVVLDLEGPEPQPQSLEQMEVYRAGRPYRHEPATEEQWR